MTSLTTEPSTLRSIPTISTAAAATPRRRSYSCYNCSHSFHITPTDAAASAASPSSFRCPRCLHRHILPHYTIYPPPSTPTAPSPVHNHDFASDASLFIYRTAEDSEFVVDDYDSGNSLLSFTVPDFHPRTPASKSFVRSLPIKTFSPNSTPSLPSCSICMEDFEIKPDTSAIVNELPCEHYFHKDCIVEWLRRSNTCPLCRCKLPVDPGPGERFGTGPTRWEVEFDAVLVVGPPVLGVGGLDAMRDEDGDVLMIDA